MKPKACLLFLLGFSLLIVSKSDARISWTGDVFNYTAQDLGGIYYDCNGGVPVLLSASSVKSGSSSTLENTEIATAIEPRQTGLTMGAGAWGNSFQILAGDSGGATVYAYADNCFALDNSLGVSLDGQNVSSYIDRSFTVDSTATYTLSVSALAPIDWSGTSSGTASAPRPQLTGEVQIFQTDPHNMTTMLLDPQTFSLANLAASSQQAGVTLVAGDSYQFVVAVSGVTATGGIAGTAGIATSFNNLNITPGSVSWLGAIDGAFNVGTQASPVTITASLAPAPYLWQSASDCGNGWLWLAWFDYFNISQAPWIYHRTLGWLYPYGTSTDNIWFWDPGMNTFWWTSQTVYPSVYRSYDRAWLYYQTGSFNPRWFYNFNTGLWEQD